MGGGLFFLLQIILVEIRIPLISYRTLVLEIFILTERREGIIN